jgi:hypothetical protein
MLRRLCLMLALPLAGVILLATPLAALADGSWIDTPGPNWNAPGMAVPTAPAFESNDDPRCGADGRWAESPEDQALVQAGWRLYGSYQAGWGVRVITGLSGYDGMCRPLGFQEFVFVDGVFAGTISPVPMDSRTDGSGWVSWLGHDRLTARFNRYTDLDPLCCPSGESVVQYRVERGADGPVLARELP